MSESHTSKHSEKDLWLSSVPFLLWRQVAFYRRVWNSVSQICSSCKLQLPHIATASAQNIFATPAWATIVRALSTSVRLNLSAIQFWWWHVTHGEYRFPSCITERHACEMYSPPLSDRILAILKPPALVIIASNCLNLSSTSDVCFII